MKSYLFSTGAIREVEKKLFSPNIMERMIDAETTEKSFKIFNELSYVDEVVDIKNPERYREIVSHDLGQVKNFLSSITPSQDIMNYIFSYYDFQNIKKIFKAKYNSIEKMKFLFDLGIESHEKLTEIILKENTKISISEELQVVINDAFKDLEKEHSPYQIDSYFDKKYFKYLFNKSKIIGDKTLIALLKTQIDIANIKIAFRSKLLERPVSDVKKDIVPNGNMDRSSILANYNNDLVDIVKTIKNNIIDTKFINDINKFIEHKTTWRLEKYLDNYLIRYLKEIKTNSQGPAAIVAYFLGKKNAIRNIRIIMGGKINNIDTLEIKKSVRELY